MEAGTPRKHAVLIGVLGLMLVGLVLRLVGIGAKAYWQDEVGTVHVLERGFTGAMRAVESEQNNPPLYYLLGWPWAHLFGTGEVELRTLSTLFTVALIPIAYLAGRQLLSPRVGLISAALVATNPLLVWYGQEAKSYALLTLLAGLSFLLFLRALDDESTGRLLAWGVCCALAVASHYFAVIFVAVEAIWLLWVSRQRLRVVAAGAIPVLTGVALAPLAASQGTPGWLDEASVVSRVVATPAVFIVGFETPAPYLVTGLAALICALGLWLLVARSTPADRRRGLLALAVAAASFACALIAFDYFLYRNVIASLLPLLVGLACGFGAVRAGRLGVGAAAALCLGSAAVVLGTAHTPKFGKEDWRNAAKALGGGKERAIVLTPEDGRLSLIYYLDEQAAPLQGDGARVDEIAVVAGAVRPLGRVVAARTPDTATPAAPPGFELVGRQDERYYTVITYRAPGERWISRQDLLALALDDNDPQLILERG